MVKQAKPGADIQLTGDKAAAKQIAAARAAFNQALSERDFSAIEAACARIARSCPAMTPS